ncbi:MAG: glycosyltransferase family 4 protein [Nocardioidaceae bacterium]
MRVLHLTDHYPPALGGIETHVALLAERQAARGDDVTVLTPSPAASDGRVSSDTGPVRVLRTGSNRAAVAEGCSGYDVVHAHVSVVAPFTSPVAATLARRGVPTLVTVHSLWNGLGPVPATVAALQGLLGAPVTWSAVSTLAAEVVRSAVRGRPTVLVVPNAVDVAARVASPAPGGPVTLVSTMRIARRKRPRQLVMMMDAVRRTAATPVRLVIVGDGPLHDRVLRDVRGRGLDGLVTVTGRLEPAEVLRTLSGADVYVAPAVLESFGLAVLEARCVGLPVVGRADSGMTDFVTDGVEGSLSRSDAGMVADLVELVDDPGLRTRMAEHNRTTPSRMTWAHAMLRNDEAYAVTVDRARGAVRAGAGR